MLEGLDDEDAGVRAAAAWASAAPDAKGELAANVGRLLGDTSHESGRVREAAEKSIREMGAEGATSAASRLDSGKAEMRCAACWAIGVSGAAGAKYTPAVRMRLADADFSVRRAAVDTLRAIGDFGTPK